MSGPGAVSEPGPSWLPRTAPLLATGRRILVARDDHSREELEAWLQPADVVLFAGDLGDLHRRLSMLGPCDVIVDASGRGGSERRLVCALHHLRRGGQLVSRLPPRGTRTRERLEKTLNAVRELLATGDGVAPARGDRRRGRERDLHALAASMGPTQEWITAQRCLVVEQHASVLAHLTDSDLDEATLARRPGLARVVTQAPAVVSPVMSRFTSTDPAERGLVELRAPALTLREYHDVQVHPRMVVTAPGIVLPDTFRHPGRPSTPALAAWDRGSVLAPTPEATKRLPGVWLHADSYMRGHFGHALTEQLSKLWAWELARERWSGVGVLVSTNLKSPAVAAWELELFEAAGVPRSLVHVLAEPVQVETLVSGTPAYEIDGYIHPVMEGLYDRVGDALAAAGTVSGASRRVFLTRTPSRRACRNADEVHALFERHGFDIVLPETLSLSDQVSLARGADVIAGFGGSAMFHIAFTTRKQVIAISHDNYHVANEKFMAAFRGHDLSVFRCRADTKRGERFSNAWFHSDYHLDMEVEGRALEERLRTLA